MLSELVCVFKVLKCIEAWVFECDWEITKSNKGEGTIEEWAQTKIGRRNKTIEKKRSKRKVEKNKEFKSVEHSTICSKVTTTFTIIFIMWRRQNIQWEDVIYAHDNSRYI
jgi:hypothetical protein